MTAMLDHAALKAALHYDPETGVWTRLVRARGSRVLIGGRVDNKSHDCRRVNFAGKRYRAHRLAWFYMTGNWPEEEKEVDHKDINHQNNIWSNLRLSTHSQNMGNRTKQRDNTSGYKGVYWVEANKKWRAQIKYQGVNKNLGYAHSPAEAHRLYQLAARLLFGEFARD